MVVGIDRFRAHFTGHEDKYAIIGGAACDLLFDRVGLPFRATKDIDVVLCVEAVDVAFGEAFLAFINAGGYQARERSDGRKEFYRFHRPKDASYPFMIELFARQHDVLNFVEGAELIPIPVEESVLSLSAILLESDYYDALRSAKSQVEGVTIIDESLLIPFKARAFLDLTERSRRGERIDSRSIKKHRNDVFRLSQLLPANADIEMPTSIKQDLQQFLKLVQADSTLSPKDFGVQFSRDEAIALLRSAFGIE